MKKNLLLILTAVFCCLFTTTAFAQCSSYAAGPYSDQGALDIAGCDGETVAADYAAWLNEVYVSQVVAGGNYTIFLDGANDENWSGAPVITVHQGLEDPTLMSADSATDFVVGSSLTFAATVDGNAFFVFSTADACGAELLEVENGVPTLTTDSGVECPEVVCGNGICENGEDSANCPEDCGTPGETCFNPSWVNAIGGVTSTTPVTLCNGSELLIAIGTLEGGVEGDVFNVVLEGGATGLLQSDGENLNEITELDYAAIAFVYVTQENVNAEDGFTVTLNNLNDPDCLGSLSLTWSELGIDGSSPTGIDDYCLTQVPPSNDICDEAVALVNGENGPFSNANATVEASEIACDDFFDAEVSVSVWFTFFGSGGDVTITANNSCEGLGTTLNNDTQFAIYEESCAGDLVGCNDDIFYEPGNDDNNFLSTLTIPTDNGTIYYLMVDGYASTSGDFCLEVEGVGAPCEVEGPTVVAAASEVCQVEGEVVEIVLADAGSGSSGVVYMLTDFNGQQEDFTILAGPQISASFDVAGLPVGDLIAWAVSVEDEATDTNGTIGGLQGCFELSNYVLVTILDESDADCFNSTIKLDNVQAMNIFPQPASTQATLALTTNKADAMNLQVVDVTGKVVAQRDILVNAGENLIDLDINNFASGIYFVQVANESGLATAKLIKK